jgi:hypothetical protein
MIRKKCTNLVSAAVLGLTALTATPPTQAGLVWFSRANCVNNESISWDWPGNNRWLWTNSFHFKNGRWEEPIRTGWQYTWRSAAVHWGEGFQRGYLVVGNHYQWFQGYGEYFFGRTETTNCNIGYFFPYW